MWRPISRERACLEATVLGVALILGAYGALALAPSREDAQPHVAAELAFALAWFASHGAALLGLALGVSCAWRGWGRRWRVVTAASVSGLTLAASGALYLWGTFALGGV